MLKLDHQPIAAGLVALAAALAQPGAARAATADAQAFLADWRQAVGQPAGDAMAQAVADRTAFPFLFESRPLDRRAFVAQAVPALFKPVARRCLQRARPVAEDGRLVLTCPPYGYVFGPTPAGWRLIEFFVDAP